MCVDRWCGKLQANCTEGERWIDKPNQEILVQRKACPDFGKLQDGKAKQNIIKNGHPKRGVQRYQCKTCGKTFTETTGTLFFRKRTPEHEILETRVLLAEGSRISSLSRAKGFKEGTILAWLREAAQHAEGLEAVVMKDFKFGLLC